VELAAIFATLRGLAAFTTAPPVTAIDGVGASKSARYELAKRIVDARSLTLPASSGEPTWIQPTTGDAESPWAEPSRYADTLDIGRRAIRGELTPREFQALYEWRPSPVRTTTPEEPMRMTFEPQLYVSPALMSKLARVTAVGGEGTYGTVPSMTRMAYVPRDAGRRTSTPEWRAELAARMRGADWGLPVEGRDPPPDKWRPWETAAGFRHDVEQQSWQRRFAAWIAAGRPRRVRRTVVGSTAVATYSVVEEES
jgi:hypothetical protein